ncbi:hypothetical protein PQR34_46315 [Paraburkholderia sediminicola]|uniref:hypothetical protein n=1 Tax=Paraburkholderia sediminicola TaxID=458836 RepID=UPI0038BAB88C
MRILTLLALAPIALGACALHPVAQAPCPPVVPTLIVDKGCQWAKFITASTNDTSETRRQIIANNQALIANCPDRVQDVQP